MTTTEDNNSSNNQRENQPSEEINTTTKVLNHDSDSSSIALPPARSNRILIRQNRSRQLSLSWLIIVAVGISFIGLVLNLGWVSLPASLVTLLLSLRAIYPGVRKWLVTFLTADERKVLVGALGFVLAMAILFKYLGIYQLIANWLTQFKYDEFGSWADWVGALGQILIAVLAVYVAWEQYVISRDLTIQQNRITQQQTIDAYFQGVSDLALNDEGLLEDWPQERAIAEGRTAAIFSSVDAAGKAKILRFLSQSRLLTPLKRDNYLGRPILDGLGGYAEDRQAGIRVINLGVILAGTNLAGQDLRWTELSEANMVRANLRGCDLVKANLSRTILYEADLSEADLKGTRLFYGLLETATPRSRNGIPNYETGEYTGAVVEKVNLTGVKRLSEEQICYFCAWGGEKTRATIPGGCEGIPNRLGR
ncbi:MAG: pentapeptide repeat-containing protein [Cyanobacteria bacterium J083]|nr:MAG: pentapeptide repeat-containing protein [Cyanobacteria bacterium J083]